MNTALQPRTAAALILLVSAATVGGAFAFQYLGGYAPCILCWWQRYAHFAAVALALVSTVAAPKRLWIVLAGLAVLASGLIGAFHAGVEYGWWEGFTACTTTVEDGGDPLEAIMNAPLIRCDVAQWTLAGVSLAGFNAVISVLSALAIFVLAAKDRRA